MKDKKRNNHRARTLLTILLLLGGMFPLQAQQATLEGKVYEMDHHGKKLPLGYATLSFPDYGIGTLRESKMN